MAGVLIFSTYEFKGGVEFHEQDMHIVEATLILLQHALYKDLLE